MDYLKKLAELVVVTFVAAALPALVAAGSLSKAAVAGAVSAGLAAVYGVVVKNKGAEDRPTVK